MGIFSKFNKKKTLKEKQEMLRIEQEKLEKLSCKEYENYKNMLSATSSQYGKYEEIAEDEKNKTCIAYTKYGPLMKKHVCKEYKRENYNYAEEYDEFEGYISTDDKNIKPGYYHFRIYSISYPNPIERETIRVNEYKGYLREIDGYIEQIKERVRGEEYCEYKNVVKHFEKTLNQYKENQKNQEF